MREVLADIGLFFVIATALTAAGGYVELRRKGREVTWPGMFSALGMGAFVIWFVIGLGAIAWLVALVFGIALFR